MATFWEELPPLLAMCSHCIFCLYVILFISRFGFEGWFWVFFVAPVPVHCLLVTFEKSDLGSRLIVVSIVLIEGVDQRSYNEADTYMLILMELTKYEYTEFSPSRFKPINAIVCIVGEGNPKCSQSELVPCGDRRGIYQWEFCSITVPNQRITYVHLDRRYRNGYCTKHNFGITTNHRRFWVHQWCYGTFIVCFVSGIALYILNAKNLAPLSISIFFWFKTDNFKF